VKRGAEANGAETGAVAGSDAGKEGWWARLPVRRRRKRLPELSFCAAVDAGSTALRVLVVAPGADGATVWGWGERPAGSDPVTMADDSAEAFEEALTTAEAMAEDRAERWRAADQIVVGLPAWQVRGWAAPVIQRRAQASRAIDERELEALLSRALRLSLNKVKAEDEDWVLLDAVPAALGVDGQGVTDPVGFRGAELIASVFAVAARAQTVEGWRQLAERNGFLSLTITAGALALAACPTGPQGIVLDVGGAHTSAVWWRGGRPMSADSVSTGSGLLTECLVRKWGMSSEKAQTLQRSFAAGHLAADVRAQIAETLEPALGVWFQTVEGMLAEMHERAGEPLPHRMLVCGGGSAVPEMMDAARALIWSQRFTFERYPELDRLRPTDVPGITNRTELGRAAGDVSALALAAWAAESAKPAGRPARILHKLCQQV
jgi:hypothetical protein